MSARLTSVVFAIAALAMVLAATAQAQFSATQNPPPNTAMQFVAAPNSAPIYAVLPAGTPTTNPAQLQEAPAAEQPSQNATAVDYTAYRSYASAAISDTDADNNRTATANSQGTIRSRGMANQTSAAGPRQTSGFAYSSDAGSAGGQSPAPPQQFRAPPTQLLNYVPGKYIPVSPGSNMLADDPNAPPDPNSISNSPVGNDGNSGGDDSSGSGACGCNSCGCESCQSGCCDCCRDKLFPIIQMDDPCPLECPDCPADHLFSENCWLNCHDLSLTGWLDGGIMGNGRNTPDRFNGPLTFADRRDGQANQAWFALDRSAPADNCGWFIGGHVDYFFGSDYFFTTAAGLDGTSFGNVPRWNTTDSFQYGFAMPQLYAETDYGTDTKIKWGHFFTIIGYEVVPAIGNFFYSHSYTMQYGEPFTHTGMLASQTHCNWTFYGGITSGWNTFDANDRAGFLGGITYTDKDWGSVAFAITTGDDSEFNFPGVGPFANRTMYSLVWSRNFTSRLTYVLQHDLGSQNDAITFQGRGAQWYGINQYLFYKLNCCWTAGIRAEWFRDDDGFVVTGLRPGNAIVGASFPGNFYEMTAGLNYKPNGNLAIRPEVRWDWYDGQPNQNFGLPTSITQPYNAGARSNQFTYGVDMIFQW